MNCTKCSKRLVYESPVLDFTHCGTDYWTKYGERRLHPKICMSCRTKVGRHAQSYQQNLITNE